MKQTFTIFVFLSFALLCQAQKKLIVSLQGNADFKSIQEALDAVPLNNKRPVIIYIRKGMYREKLVLPATKNNVSLIGEDRFNTIITYDDHPGKISPKVGSVNTRNSYTFQINANNFSALNLTFRNDAGFAAGQAVALDVRGDMATFVNCRIIGNQDILLADGDRSRQYYQNCYIEGTTDFIFGSATAWFEQCHIHSKKNSHITAASTPESNKYGYIFYDCKITGDTSLHKVSLGRPWRPYAAVTYLYSYLGPHIMNEGWANWNNTESYKTARYSEYKNYGARRTVG